MKTDDVLVSCAKCAATIGYVVPDGHLNWLCAECAGLLNPKAITAKEATQFALGALAGAV